MFLLTLALIVALGLIVNCEFYLIKYSSPVKVTAWVRFVSTMYEIVQVYKVENDYYFNVTPYVICEAIALGGLILIFSDTNAGEQTLIDA